MSAAGQMHIGYVLKRFPRISETFVAAELLELQRQGQRVTVFALSRPLEAFTHRFLGDLDVSVVYLPHRPLRQAGRTARALLRVFGRSPGRWMSAASAVLAPPSLRGWRRLLQATVLVDELRAHRIDHMHAHFASTAARIAYLARRMGGPSYSVTAHAKDIYHQEVSVARLAQTLGAASFVATVSEDNVTYLDRVLQGRSRVALVRNSVDMRRFEQPGERLAEPATVVSVARLVEKKGLDDLVRACGLLAKGGTAVRLDLVGDGPLREQLTALAAEQGADVRFLGSLDHDEVLACYRRAAVFSLPCVIASTGDRDGLPTAVLEAMASGLPAVTTGVNGLAEAVIDGETGLVVPPRDPAALAAAIGSLIDDPARAERLGARAREHVAATFSLVDSATRLRMLFTEHARTA